MSYSRWGSSVWYTFWAGNSEIKEEQLFSVDCSREFTYAEIKELDVVKLGMIYNDREEVEIQELWQYMLEFIADMNIEY